MRPGREMDGGGGMRGSAQNRERCLVAESHFVAHIKPSKNHFSSYSAISGLPTPTNIERSESDCREGRKTGKVRQGVFLYFLLHSLFILSDGEDCD